jgi:hypothetical protein
MHILKLRLEKCVVKSKLLFEDPTVEEFLNFLTRTFDFVFLS